MFRTVLTTPVFMCILDVLETHVKSSSNVKERRIWDKKNCCLFCGTFQAKLTRHVERKHKSEDEVQKMLRYPKRSKKRKMESERLRHLGNFYNNAKVLASGEGDFLVAKRPVKGMNMKVSQFVPCAYCKGYYMKAEIWRHINDCNFKDTNETDTCTTESFASGIKRGKSIMLACLKPALDNVGRECLFSVMKNDDISSVCRNDELIYQHGINMLHTKGADHASYIRTKMRELGRLVIQARKSLGSVNLKDLIQPDRFDHVIDAVKKECRYATDKISKFEIPSLALKMGYSLKQCAELKLGLCIRDKDTVGEDETNRFLKLYDMEYSDKISSVALETLHTKKARKPAILPVTNDIVEFQKYVREKIPQITKQVKLTQDSGLFKDLAQMTLSSLIVFNKRRSGETSKMLLSDLKENKKGNEDIAAMLSDVEQTLCKR